MASTPGPFEHERFAAERFQLIPYLQRSSWGAAGLAVLALLSLFLGEGGSLPGGVVVNVVVAAVLFLVAFLLHQRARRLDERRSALKAGKLPPEVR